MIGLPRSLTRAASTCAVVILLLVAFGQVVVAESTSTRVILSHVPTISNWGPATANGVVVYTLEEGDVRADLVGLPVLDDSQRYELWLVNSQSAERFSVVRFNAASDGDVTYIDQLLPDTIPDHGWDQVQVTVEPEPDDGPDFSGQIAIVGGVAGTSAEALQFPPILPETGVASRDDSGAAALATLISATILLIITGRRMILKRGGLR